MQKSEEAFKIAALTLEKYRKNKTLVPPEDLAGKYKVPFQNLKNQLKREVQEYLETYCLGGLLIAKDDCEEVVAEINQAYADADVGKRIGRAIFKDFDLEAVKQIAEEHRQRIYKIWERYFNEHTCLYANAPCFIEGNPQIPFIYNTLVDKFWDESTGTWIDREKPPGEALLISISEKEKAHE